MRHRLRLDSPGAIAAAAQRYGFGSSTDEAQADRLSFVLARVRERGLLARVTFESGGLAEDTARRIGGLTLAP
ncbi:MAG: hypothetical protein HUU27_07210 [Phycisphaerae bacterium]|nr:hypothetical protein [Phycisphaerae bacterium]